MDRAGRPRPKPFGPAGRTAWGVLCLLLAVVASAFPVAPGPLALPALVPALSGPSMGEGAGSRAAPLPLADPTRGSAGAPPAAPVNDSPAYWYPDNGTAPAPRTDPAYAASPSTAAVFGGYSNSTPGCPLFSVCALGETWVRPAASGLWTNVTPSPPSATNTPSDRWGATMAYDPSIGAFVLFGGTTAFPNGFNNPALGDTWLLSAGTDTWTLACRSCIAGTSTPTPRWGAASAYEPGTGKVILFGGETTNAGATAYLNDTWAFNGTAWTPLAQSTAPSNRSGAALAWDGEHGPPGELVLFGGFSAGAAAADTWVFSSGGWSAATPASSPAAMGGAAAVTDPINGSVVLFGGCAGRDPCTRGLSGAAWSWTNANWHLLRPAGGGPPARYESALFALPAKASIVVFGGDVGGAPANDTYSMFRIEAHAVRASAYTVDIGNTVTLNVTAVGGQGNLTYRWFGLPGGCASQNASSIPCDPSGPGPLSVSVRVLVSDPVGEAVFAPAASLRFNAVPDVVPLGRPTSGVVPLQVSFSTTISGGTGPIVLNWSFGDGGVGTGPAPTHTYLVSGNFTAAVWANDSLGGSTQRTIAIQVIPRLQAHLTVRPDPWTLATNASQVVASATGGLPPYNFTFAALPSGCERVASAPVTYDCRPSTTGDFSINVSVTDHSGQRAQTNATLSVVAPPATGPARSSTWVGWLYGALALVGVALALALFVWARRRGRRARPRPMTTVPVPEPHELPAAGGSLYVPPPGPTGRPPKRRV